MAPTPLIMVGAGGFARETIELVRAINREAPAWELLGLLDDDPELRGHGAARRAGARPLRRRSREYPEASFVACVASPDDPLRRLRLVARLGLRLERYATLIHPRAIVADSATIGPGSVVHANCVLTADIGLGWHVAVMPAVVLTHDDTIEDGVTFGAGAHVAGGGDDRRRRLHRRRSAAARAASRSAPGAVIGMGSVVTKSVPRGEVWYGAPARPASQPPTARGCAGEAPGRPARPRHRRQPDQRDRPRRRRSRGRPRGHRLRQARPAGRAGSSRAASSSSPARPLRYRPAPSRIAQLAGLARRRRLDLIHAYEWPPCLDAYYGAHLLGGVPLLCTVLSMSVSPYVPPSVPLMMGTAALAERGAPAPSGAGLGAGAADRHRRRLARGRRHPAAPRARHRRREPAAWSPSRDSRSSSSWTPSSTRSTPSTSWRGELPVTLLVVGDGPAGAALRARAEQVNRALGPRGDQVRRRPRRPARGLRRRRPGARHGQLLAARDGDRPSRSSSRGSAASPRSSNPPTATTSCATASGGSATGEPNARRLASQIRALLGDPDAARRARAPTAARPWSQSASRSARHRTSSSASTTRSSSSAGARRWGEAATAAARALRLELDNHDPRRKRARERSEREKLSAAERLAAAERPRSPRRVSAAAPTVARRVRRAPRSRCRAPGTGSSCSAPPTAGTRSSCTIATSPSRSRARAGALRRPADLAPDPLQRAERRPLTAAAAAAPVSRRGSPATRRWCRRSRCGRRCCR